MQVLGGSSGVRHGQHGSQKQQRRMLSIHEYLAMNILRENGISVPKYEVADSAQKAFDIAADFGKYLVYLIFRAHCKQIQGGTGVLFRRYTALSE